LKYFTELQERRILDSEGRVVGKLHDMGVQPTGRFPMSKSLIISRYRRGRRETVAVPWDWVKSLGPEGIVLDRTREEIWKSQYEDPGLLLGRNLLDHQIVDLHGNKVVRVNDLRLAEFDTNLRLTGVDISQKALLRRLGLTKATAKLIEAVGGEAEERTISWHYVAPLELRGQDLKLKVTQSQLSELHPTDIADIIEQLDPPQRERLLDLLDNFTAAESLSEVEPGKQADVIEGLSEIRASNLLEIMPPDEAADILSHLPRDKAERILNIMGVREAEVIRELLGYREDTAGGRMTPEFLAVPSSYTAQECIEYLRDNAPSAETLYYLYVIDDEKRLKGVVSLRDLLTSPPSEKVEEFMRRDVVSVHVDDDQEIVAEMMSRYNFLALPVVDDDNLIKGIITVDDMIDVIREEAIEDLSHLGGLELSEISPLTSLLTRLPSVVITLLGGIGCALILSAFESRLLSLIALIFFLPLILRVAQQIGITSQAVVLEEIGGRELAWKEVLLLAWKELRVVILLSLLLGLAGSLIAGLWEGQFRFGLSIGLALFVSLVLSSLVGISIPLIARRAGRELHFAQMRFSTLLMSVAAITIYLGMSVALV